MSDVKDLLNTLPHSGPGMLHLAMEAEDGKVIVTLSASASRIEFSPTHATAVGTALLRFAEIAQKQKN